MSGDPGTLACGAAGLSDEGPRKRLLREVDLFLLIHQFVAILKGCGRYKKVKARE